MSAEWVTAIATAGTFLVIAASAGAALFQLQHMRSSNQIVALTELRETIESSEFRAHWSNLLGPFQDLLRDPDFRDEVMSNKSLSGLNRLQSAVTIGNLFENAGVLIKHGIIDSDLFCDLWSANVLGAWDAIAPLIANRRLITGPTLYENFEYLVLLAENFDKRYPQGTFHGSVRKKLPDAWPESARYAKRA